MQRPLAAHTGRADVGGDGEQSRRDDEITCQKANDAQDKNKAGNQIFE